VIATINSYTKKELRELFVLLGENCFPLQKQTHSITLLLFFLRTGKGHVNFSLSTKLPLEEIKKCWYKPLLKKYRLLSSEELYKKMSCTVAEEFEDKEADEYIQQFKKILFEVPLDQLPLYVDEIRDIEIAVTWRLNRGK
jgi:hypothetical protein